MSTVDTHVLPSGTWQVDKVHSSIGFAVDYMAGTFHGTFSDFDAVVAMAC
jgi:polyisoprenoid-binding protein YceI